MVIPSIRLDNFEGPFDLLLHLIKKNEMDIHDIRIYEITNQYLDYLNKMKEMDLDITSEFIVMAATLLEIKSKTLLPKQKTEVEEEENDPRKELVEKLIIYKQIKGAAEYLREKILYTGEIFTKKPEIINDKPSEFSNEELFKNITMLDLFNLYNELIQRYKDKKNTNNIIERRISADTFKIEDKMKYILDISSTITKDLNFTQLIQECTCKLEAVVTFLAVLELIKQREIKIIQIESFGEIYIERLREDGES